MTTPMPAEPDKPKTIFIAAGPRVMETKGIKGDVGRAVAIATSNTFAKRIAAALNNHTPDRRGI